MAYKVARRNAGRASTEYQPPIGFTVTSPFTGSGALTAAASKGTTTTGAWKSAVVTPYDSPYPGAAQPGFATWRGTPVSGQSRYGDSDSANGLNAWPYSTAGQYYYDWPGDTDWAPGAIWAAGGNGSVTSWSAAASGGSDTFWTNSLTNMKNAWTRITRGTFYIRFAHELNGNWYDWSVQPSMASDFITAWRRYYNLKQSIFPAAKLVFCTNANSVGQSYNWGTTIWPGDAYVDVHGVDWYSDHWTSCGSNVENTTTDGGGGPFGLRAHLNFALAHGKPLCVGEWGSRPGFDDANYVQQMHDFFAAHGGTGAGNLLYESFYNDLPDYQYYPTTTHPNCAARYQSIF